MQTTRGDATECADLVIKETPVASESGMELELWVTRVEERWATSDRCSPGDCNTSRIAVSPWSGEARKASI